MLRTLRLSALAGTLAVGVLALPASSPVRAANSPTFRDCSLILEGVDPDFVQISGVTVTPQGTLTVSTSQNSVQLLASESSDPMDQTQHVTFSVTVSSGKLSSSRTVSGAGTGKVLLTVPLIGSGTGRTFTINWQAVFDGGGHPCPGANTPDNTTANPFVVTVD